MFRTCGRSGRCTSGLLLDLEDHSRAFIPILHTVEPLNNVRGGIGAFIPVSKEEAFLNEIKALGRLSFMLLANVLWSVTETCLFEEIEFRTLIEAWVAIVFVRIEQLHWLLVPSDAQFVQFVNEVFLF